jgi:hypothetical protein
MAMELTSIFSNRPNDLFCMLPFPIPFQKNFIRRILYAERISHQPFFFTEERFISPPIISDSGNRLSVQKYFYNICRRNQEIFTRNKDATWETDITFDTGQRLQD